ncbi:MAG: DUF2298 domain-containing protein [Candidatus Aenigmarchaeota archaeon]|nr:DUF2298 domain-containing protein [Candidatus Aenigmarchaeota archaeon]
MFEIFLWYFIFQLINLVTLPICFGVFKNLHDRGYSINKAFSFLIASFIVYFLTRIIGLNFSLNTILISLFFLLFLYILNLKNLFNQVEIKKQDFLKHIIISEIIFLSLFLLALFFKSFRPDLDHGEGPMDFAYIQSMIRSEKLPPEYPWMSGINLENVYYYFGHFSYAIIIKLSGIETSKGYILSLATAFALVGISSFSIGFNLTKNYKVAFLCMFLITFGSSLLPIFHLISSINPEIQFNITEHRVSNHGNFFSRFLYDGQLFWWSTRVIPWTITEFPWFSLLWGDLHAHFVSYSFIFVFVHLIFDILNSNSSGFGVFGSNLKEILVKILIISISLGYLFPQFIWNYPIYVIFLGICLFSIYYEGKINIKFLFYLIISFLIIVFLSLVIYFEPIKNLMELNHSRSGLVFENLKTSLFNFFVLYGLQMLMIYSYFIYKIFNNLVSKKLKMFFIILMISYFILFLNVILSYFQDPKRFDMPINVNWLSIKSVVYDFQIIIVLVPFTILSIFYIIFKIYEDNKELFLIISILFGTVVIWIFELFNIYGRYVFVFKLHQSVWIFWNIATILILFYFKDRMKKTKFMIFLSIFFIFLSSSIMYIVLTSITETGLFKPNYGRNYLTIDSMEFIKQNYPEEYNAIVWINKNIKGKHVILEYPGISYEFYPRPSTFTGLSALVEWLCHAEQVTLKNANKIAEKVNLIYNTTDINESIYLLKENNVDFIYIGKMEKDNYLYEGLEKFELDKNNFVKIYDNGVIIYKFLG